VPKKSSIALHVPQNKGGVSSLWAELGASNPSLLMSCGKVVVGGTMVFNGDSPTSTGFYHNGHSEWKHRIYDSAPNFREVQRAGSAGMNPAWHVVLQRSLFGTQLPNQNTSLPRRRSCWAHACP
jgi:hypothetical protein